MILIFLIMCRLQQYLLHVNGSQAVTTAKLLPCVISITPCMPGFRGLCRDVPQYRRDKVVTRPWRSRHHDSSKHRELLPTNTEDLSSQPYRRKKLKYCDNRYAWATEPSPRISWELRVVIKELLDIRNVLPVFCLLGCYSVRFGPLAKSTHNTVYNP
jgi:hypothetical protein